MGTVQIQKDPADPVQALKSSRALLLDYGGG